MNRIFSTTIASTINQLIEKFGKIEYQDQLIEAWVFGDKNHRQQAEEELSKYGVNAKLRSAYKPLLHFFLEEIDVLSSNIKSIEVHYPLHKAASEKRFLLETYPLSALLKKIEIHFVANEKMTDAYQVILHSDAGVQSQYNVFAPNHLHQDLIEQTHLSPTGWLRITNSEGVITLNERLVTDYESLFLKA